MTKCRMLYEASNWEGDSSLVRIRAGMAIAVISILLAAVLTMFLFRSAPQSPDTPTGLSFQESKTTAGDTGSGIQPETQEITGTDKETAEPVSPETPATPEQAQTLTVSPGDGQKPVAPEPMSPAATEPQGIPVLYYHAVDEVPGNELYVRPAELDRQLAYLVEQGYHSISLAQLYQFLSNGQPLPAKPVALTFDDGYQDNYLKAAPILRKYGFTATVFMISGDIDAVPEYLTKNELVELTKDGWQIESHTVNHLYLTSLSKELINKELTKSKADLETATGSDVLFFTYPYGDYDNKVIQAVRDAGYLMAFTTAKGLVYPQTDLMRIPRVYIYAGMDPAEFARRVEHGA